jgi:hypothetical protein
MDIHIVRVASFFVGRSSLHSLRELWIASTTGRAGFCSAETYFGGA